MSQFNWQQDADDQWEEPVVYIPEPKNPRPRRRWGLILILLLLLGSVAWLLTRQANQRVEETTTAVSDDILSSHNLLIQAAHNNDNDLFTALLSGRDKEWTASQQTLLSERLFLNRPSFALYTALPESPDLGAIEDNLILISLDLAPDLLAAELVTQLPYTFTLPDGTIQNTILQQTAVYRLGSQRWLYAPPEEDFWGGTRNYEQNRLITIYPQRDEEIAQRLTIDLAQALNRICTQLADINCPDDLTINLVLSTDPNSLSDLTDPQTLWQSGSRTVLPTPSLVGLPIDEAGYQALKQGYTVQLTTAVISHLVEYECCVGAAYFQALLDYQLSQLDLQTWPITQTDYQRVLDETIGLNRVFPTWQAGSLADVGPEEQWLIRLIADFVLHSDHPTSAAAAQRTLNQTTSLISWLASTIFTRTERAARANNVLQEWHKTASIRSQISTMPPPIPLPEQDLLVICTNDDLEADIEGSSLYRYHLATDEWTLEDESDAATVMVPFPDDSAVILQSFGADPFGPKIWQNGQLIQSVIDDEARSLISFGHFYPSGLMLAYELSSETITPQLIDLTQCQNSQQCPTEAKPGLLTESPNGRQTIIAKPFSLSINYLPINGRHLLLDERLEDQEPDNLFRTNGTEEISIGTGFAPFWLDDETYGYLRSSDTNIEIVIAQTADDILNPVLSRNTLLHLLPGDDNFASSFNINYVLTEPTYPDQLFIVATSGRNLSPRQVHIFSYNLVTHRIRLHVQTNYIGVHSLDFSPDGRWLIVNDWQENIGGQPINLNFTHLHDLSQNQSDSFTTITPLLFPAYLHDWSANGQWLALLANNNQIALTIPGTDHYQIIQHGHGPCASLAWVTPLE